MQSLRDYTFQSNSSKGYVHIFQVMSFTFMRERTQLHSHSKTLLKAQCP